MRSVGPEFVREPSTMDSTSSGVPETIGADIVAEIQFEPSQSRTFA